MLSAALRRPSSCWRLTGWASYSVRFLAILAPSIMMMESPRAGPKIRPASGNGDRMGTATVCHPFSRCRQDRAEAVSGSVVKQDEASLGVQSRRQCGFCESLGGCQSCSSAGTVRLERPNLCTTGGRHEPILRDSRPGRCGGPRRPFARTRQRPPASGQTPAGCSRWRSPLSQSPERPDAAR